MLPFLLATSLAGCPSASPTPDAAMREDAPAPPDAHEPAPDAHVEPWEAPPECATLGSGDTSEGVVVRGNAFAFTGEGGRIEGAYVTALEHSSWCVRTAAGGAFELLGVPVGSDITLRIHHPEYVVVQTGTHTVPADGIERLTFQVPTPGIYSLLSRVVRLEADPTRCQIAATVTEIGRSLYPSKPASPSHGEAGATVSIAPAPAEADGSSLLRLHRTEPHRPGPRPHRDDARRRRPLPERHPGRLRPLGLEGRRDLPLGPRPVHRRHAGQSVPAVEHPGHRTMTRAALGPRRATPRLAPARRRSAARAPSG
jgi:hypothetical protein